MKFSDYIISRCSIQRREMSIMKNTNNKNIITCTTVKISGSTTNERIASVCKSVDGIIDGKVRKLRNNLDFSNPVNMVRYNLAVARLDVERDRMKFETLRNLEELGNSEQSEKYLNI